jgi:tRNA:m4X modification enzyme
LRDCVTAALPGVAEQQGRKRAVLGAKHLCGVASDLALRSLVSFGSHLATDVAGLGIATCCHHCCNWDDYVGRDFLASKGITGAEFSVMCGWTSWATSLCMHTAKTEGRKGDGEAEGKAEVEVEHSVTGERQLRSNERHRPRDTQPSALRLAGWWAKRAIDEGRAAFLRSLGMDAFQRYYCDKDVTPECVMLVGTPKCK